jgi:hypothetical protein
MRIDRRPLRLLPSLALLLLPLTHVAPPSLIRGLAPSPALAAPTCSLHSPDGTVKHVIFLQFDNVHFQRDNPNVPSDLEQMPHLLSFIKDNGVLLSNDHTPLMSHTATDLLTTATGLYPDRTGMPISNSYLYYNPQGTTGVASSFTYWTAKLYDSRNSKPSDTTYSMLGSDGHVAPAPWVPFTRAGCNVGAVAASNMVLENTGTDVPTVFGSRSKQAKEAVTNPAKAGAFLVGLAIHCAKGSSTCSKAHGGVPDPVPNEPGTYKGYSAIFGHQYVAPRIGGSGLKDMSGKRITAFPGFDGMTASISLGYVAAMQEHGVPVTYAYISDAHDAHPGGSTYGPGEAGYVKQLKAYDSAFATFFSTLAAHGITPQNTLFAISADEGDQFVGSNPTPQSCDGVTVACTYAQKGEVSVNMAGLLATQQKVTTPFSMYSGAGAAFYLGGDPVRDAPAVRTFDRALGNVRVTDPFTKTSGPIAHYLADPVELRLLHMITADPARTPTVVLFANPQFFVTSGSQSCGTPCVSLDTGFAWNHGTIAPTISTTWAGFVGPGIQQRGVDSTTWADHTDIRPTVLYLAGLDDRYVYDGRVLLEDITPAMIPTTLRPTFATLLQFGETYKQLTAPLGSFDLASLTASTAALKSKASGDTDYVTTESGLASLGVRRDALAQHMLSLLGNAEFSGVPIPDDQMQLLISQAQTLQEQMKTLATNAQKG